MPGPFKEGPIEISYEPSKGKQKVTVVIDFGETEENPHTAASIMLDIVHILRMWLGVRLSMYKG